MSDKTQFDISRRKLLAGLGTVGVASAGAGLGTSAYFNDTESFTNNSIQAGTLDMSVEATLEAVDDYWSGHIETPVSKTADGSEGVVGLQVSDVKPGDWAIICFDITIEDNPGYLQIMTANRSSSENGFEEPEPEDGDTNGEGELEEYILASLWHETVDNEPPDARGDLATLDDSTDRNDSNLGSYETPDVDGVTSGGAHYTTLQEAYDIYSTGVMLGGTEEPSSVNSAEFCLLLEIPTEVGNEIQGDSFEFDLLFHAEQSRHNDDPFTNNST